MSALEVVDVRDVVPDDEATIETFDDRNIHATMHLQNGARFEGGEIVSPLLLRELTNEFEKRYGALTDARLSIAVDPDNELPIVVLRPVDGDDDEGVVMCTKVEP